MAEILFYTSLVLAVASFLLFGWQVIALMQRTKVESPQVTGGAGGAQPQSLDLLKLLAELGKLSASFAKAGPLATTATLCVFFALVALVSSGIVTVGAVPR